MTYSPAAVERAMKVQEAILRALSGRQSWLQVADILGVSPRTVRRLRWPSLKPRGRLTRKTKAGRIGPAPANPHARLCQTP
jgi:hypothetical protein